MSRGNAMFTRSLLGLAASLALTAAAVAQPPAAPAPQPAAPAAEAAPRVMLPPPPPSATDLAAPPPAAPYPYPAPLGDWSGCADCGPWGTGPCGPPGKVWVTAEWLYWGMQGGYVPPLVTSAPAGTPRAAAGALFAPATSVLFGERGINNDWQSGFRFTAGAWLDANQMAGIGGDFFVLGTASESFVSPGNAGFIVTRPFINALTAAQDTQLVNLPATVAGAVAVTADTDFIGGGGHFLRNLGCDPCGRLDLTLGYRYLNLRDELTIAQSLAAADGTQFTVGERFRTRNSFHGFPIGLSWERRFTHWFVGARASVALGWTTLETDINGTTTIAAAGAAPQAFPGGLLAQTSNIGRHESTMFSVVPEAGVRFGAQVTERLRAFVSYNYLYWSRVGRVGEQVDLRVNPNLIPPSQPGGPALPAYSPQWNDFWVQGVGLGIEYRF